MADKTHVLVFPMPIQGHINPMLQFSKRLASKGLKVTFVATSSSMSKSSQVNSGSVDIETILDNFEEISAKSDSSLGFMDRFKAVVTRGLSKLIFDKKMSNLPPKVLLYDSFLPWMLDLARENGLLGATFFTQTSSVCSIIYHLHQENLTVPIKGENCVSLPGLPLMEQNDLPSFSYNGDKNQSFMGFMTDQFSNIKEVDWVIFNTFEELEEKAVSWMRSQFPLKTIGPTIPSINVNKNREDEIGYGLSLFKLSTEPYMEWLSTKPKASVIYVSFGSLASLQDEQMQELSQALNNSGHYYLWVVRASEESKLREEMSQKGLIVNWCTQTEVLAHDATGCFMTHCGWNSTIEGLTLGVPMVAMPQWSDQPTNAKFIADVWGIGVRAKVNEKNIVPREEIESCIKEVMEGEKRKQFRSNAVRWKELAEDVVCEGGSSDRNIDEFVSEITYA